MIRRGKKGSSYMILSPSATSASFHTYLFHFSNVLVIGCPRCSAQFFVFTQINSNFERTFLVRVREVCSLYFIFIFVIYHFANFCQ
ncbi:hypothetical protein IHE45_08G109600 [Dioscorea alata]|uniref:Uncharacterized protein n=1 Tax=Dioscorea alata TaxID=55571 RepID=A0ACB7VL50_DIOAL|nr:hypothetical protein IHE45_08G109600 [Dioscorea alata]